MHSLLAGIVVKQKMAKSLGGFFKYYRLYYTLFAFITLTALIIYQLKVFSPFLFSPNAISYTMGLSIGITGAIIMMVCIKKYFNKLSGLKTLYADEVQTGNALIVTGIHQHVRHPLYAGTFLFIWGLFILIPYTSLIISNFIITCYTLIGIRFEEEKLVTEFGSQYEEYKKRVPKIIPSF